MTSQFNEIVVKEICDWDNKVYQGNELRGYEAWKASMKRKLEASGEIWILDSDVKNIDINKIKIAKQELAGITKILEEQNQCIYGNNEIKNINNYIDRQEDKLKEQDKAANKCMSIIENIVGSNIQIIIREIKAKKEITKKEQLDEIIKMIDDLRPNINMVKVDIISDLNKLGYATNNEQILILINEINKLREELKLESNNNIAYELRDDDLNIKFVQRLAVTGTGETIRNQVDIASNTWVQVCKEATNIIRKQIPSNEQIAMQIKSVQKEATAAVAVINKDFKSKTLCKFFKLGKCTKGNSCNFVHDKSNNERSNNNTKKNEKCYQYYNTGKCKYEDKCKFSHKETLNNNANKNNKRKIDDLDKENQNKYNKEDSDSD